MASDEPRALPNYGHAPLPQNWYCLHCDQWRGDANGLHVHMKATHDVHVAHRGADYADGSAVQLMILQRKEWVESVPDVFARALDSLRGAEDFEFEVGAGAGIPAGEWPKRA
jgi:hypothetical protein